MSRPSELSKVVVDAESISPRKGSHSPGPLLVVLLAIAGLSALLRTQHLTGVSMSFDECCSWKISTFPTADMLDAISRDAHPPLYYFVLKALTATFGDSVSTLRGFSAVMGVATVLATAWLVSTLIEAGSMQDGLFCERDTAVLLSAALVSLSGLHIDMSMEARPYTLGTLLALLATGWLVRALREDRSEDWAGFTLSASALSLTHYYALWTAAALYCYAGIVSLLDLRYMVWPRLQRRLICIALSLWVLQLVWVPWLPTFLFQRSRSTSQLWMKPLTWEMLSDACFRALAGGRPTVVPDGWNWSGLVAWGAICLAACFSRRKYMGIIGICGLLPILFTIGYALLVRNILGVKYLIFAQMFVLIAAAVLVAGMRRKLLRIPALIGLLVWTGYWNRDVSWARHDLAAASGVRHAVDAINLHRQPGEIVIVGSPFVHPIVQKYVTDPGNIKAWFHGDHRSNILSGPALREADFQNVEEFIHGSGTRLWVIDVLDMFFPGARDVIVLADSDWELDSQHEYVERNAISCTLVVKCYTRRNPGDQPQDTGLEESNFNDDLEQPED